MDAIQNSPIVAEYRSDATVTSKGQITIPIAMRKLLGIEEGTRLQFEVMDRNLILRPEPSIDSYFGILKHLGHIDTTIPKEADRF